VLWWIGRIAPQWQPVALLSAAVGVVHLAALLIDGWAGGFTWVASFDEVDDPLYRLLLPILPDYAAQGIEFWPLHLAWVAIVIVLLYVGARTARRPAPADHPTERILLP
jgi:hypothetical protein